MAARLSGRAAIVGIGQTEFSKDSGRSELRLALEAISAALADAGLNPADVQGMSTFTGEKNPEIQVARALGVEELTFFSRVHYGGGAACATTQQAAMAVATGIADVVVVYRAFNERSGRRFGQAYQPPPENQAEDVQWSWVLPAGLVTPAGWIAMFARRYMHVSGATSEDFGRVAVTARHHAATNPRACFYERPITLEDHQASRLIVDPLRLLDCCQETDGGVAIVITGVERARGLRTTPVVVEAAAQASARDQHVMTSYYRPDDAFVEMPELSLLARQLYSQSGLGADDMQSAVIYDHFTPLVLPQLEAFGFCGRGEAKEFIRDGNISIGGALPINTHGGQLGEAYLHGMNGIVEAVRQIRGTAVNQLPDIEHVLVTAGTGVPTSGLILGRAQ